MQGMHVSSASYLTRSALPAPNSTNAAVASWRLGALKVVPKDPKHLSILPLWVCNSPNYCFKSIFACDL